MYNSVKDTLIIDVNLDKNTKEVHAVTSVYEERTTIWKHLVEILITNAFGKRKIVCHEWNPAEKVIKDVISITYNTLKGPREANKQSKTFNTI